MERIILLILCTVLTINGFSQTKEKVLQKTFVFDEKNEDNYLSVSNINGSIVISQHHKPTIEVTLKIKISGNSQSIINEGLKEIDLGVVEKGHTIYLYMDNPCSNINPSMMTEEQIRRGPFSGWKNDCKWRPKYDYLLDYEIKVPAYINLQATTVNDGDIRIEGVEGAMVVSTIFN